MTNWQDKLAEKLRGMPQVVELPITAVILALTFMVLGILMVWKAIIGVLATVIAKILMFIFRLFPNSRFEKAVWKELKE